MSTNQYKEKPQVAQNKDLQAVESQRSPSMIEEIRGIRSGLSKEKSAQDVSAYGSNNARLLSEKRQNEHKRSNS